MPTEIVKPRYACATDGKTTYVMDLNRGDDELIPVRVWKHKEGGDPGEVVMQSHKACCREHASMGCRRAMNAMQGKPLEARNPVQDILGQIIGRLMNGEQVPGVQVVNIGQGDAEAPKPPVRAHNSKLH